eukprot:SAG31_NODE_294_length_18242_cov_28.418949_8_plen_170_part_00
MYYRRGLRSVASHRLKPPVLNLVVHTDKWVNLVLPVGRSKFKFKLFVRVLGLVVPGNQYRRRRVSLDVHPRVPARPAGAAPAAPAAPAPPHLGPHWLAGGRPRPPRRTPKPRGAGRWRGPTDAALDRAALVPASSRARPGATPSPLVPLACRGGRQARADHDEDQRDQG